MKSTDLRSIRQSAGVTQEQLATLLGVRGNTVYRWESGRSPISAAVALAIVAVLGKK